MGDAVLPPDGSPSRWRPRQVARASQTWGTTYAWESEERARACLSVPALPLCPDFVMLSRARARDSWPITSVRCLRSTGSNAASACIGSAAIDGNPGASYTAPSRRETSKAADPIICDPDTMASKPREPVDDLPGSAMHVKQRALGINDVIVNGEVLARVGSIPEPGRAGS